MEDGVAVVTGASTGIGEAIAQRLRAQRARRGDPGHGIRPSAAVASNRGGLCDAAYLVGRDCYASPPDSPLMSAGQASGRCSELVESACFLCAATICPGSFRATGEWFDS